MTGFEVIAAPQLTVVLIAAFMAGLIDAMVGGGGLIQLPALLAALPSTAPPTLLGTSKLAGVFGTGSAALRYARDVQIPWKVVLPGAGLAFAAALGGAATVSVVPPDLFRPLVPFMLTAVLAYTVARKDFGRSHAPRRLEGSRLALAIALIVAIGFYDGFFGPGTGSFLMILFIRLFGFDFLNASASARVLNVATNLAALSAFGAQGHVLVGLGLAMAACNVAGALLGARLALRHGSGLVRKVFIVLVSALIARTAYDAWRAWAT
jgi:uncharacterized protein